MSQWRHEWVARPRRDRGAGWWLLPIVVLLLGIPSLLAPPTAAQTDVATFLAQPGGRLPAPLALDAVARQAVALHQANGGATVNRYFGDLTGQRLYAVVVHPELSRTVPGATIEVDWVATFARDHDLLLADPRHNVGTWYSSADDRSHLELSSALPDRDQALALGRRYNQVSVFDLFLLETLDTGGTGTTPAELPPLGARLPPVTWVGK